MNLPNSTRCIVPSNAKDIDKFNTTRHNKIHHTNRYRQILSNKICIVPYPVREELNYSMQTIVDPTAHPVE